MNEIRIMASIKHRNIVRYCDAFVERDSLFIVMEFAEHGDISRQIDKFKAANKYIKEDTVWSYLIQMCNGLITMHSRNVLHRDLKPKNVRRLRCSTEAGEVPARERGFSSSRHFPLTDTILTLRSSSRARTTCA